MMSMLQTRDFSEELWKFVGDQKGWEQSAETDLGFLRSGSAPPTVERSLSSINGIFEGSAFVGHKKRDKHDVWTDPANVECYHSNRNTNTRLSPPVLSKEGWMIAQAAFDSPWRRGNGYIGLRGFVSDQKSTEMIQDDMTQAPGALTHLPHRTCHSSVDVGMESSDSKFGHPHHGMAMATPNSLSYSYGSAFGPDGINSASKGYNESDELASKFLHFNLSQNDTMLGENHLWSHPRYFETGDLRNPFDLQGRRSSRVASKMSNGGFLTDGGLIAPYRSAFSDTDSSYRRELSRHPNYHGPDVFSSPVSAHAAKGFSVNPSYPSSVTRPLGNGNILAPAAALGSDVMGVASELQNHAARNSLYAGSDRVTALHFAALSEAELPERDCLRGSYFGFLERAYAEELMDQRRTHDHFHHFGKSGCHCHGIPAFGRAAECFSSSPLDEFKSHNTKSLELSEIAGHIVEFSSDQYGSRFIQQKLETATIEEKNIVYDEIKPEALSLMTDVFGNYVIQKFMEHGTPAQTRELADKLTGNVLALSLQMYGCRVIQKAIEVVELDQKIEMVKELDGHVMRCVRDQNGNHVIQKCIECVPEDAIRFIVSAFYDQVVTLSTHSYGCRVVQRILENCHEEKTLRTIMDEILSSVCKLAQDQYGNYVVQHVLEHGRPDERSAIICKLTGKIVQMSQQKFASNVVEKCLTFGTSTERKSLVNEMLGSTDENEPLQVMMRDQFGNYVVQKVLETCDDQQLELVLNRIKVHLNVLKKYTYGKHIVARVEKLVAAGERRISILGLNSS